MGTLKAHEVWINRTNENTKEKALQVHDTNQRGHGWGGFCGGLHGRSPVRDAILDVVYVEDLQYY